MDKTYMEYYNSFNIILQFLCNSEELTDMRPVRICDAFGRFWEDLEEGEWVVRL